MRVDGVNQLVTMYSLNVVILVGYRVKSQTGIKFRIWTNQVLKKYLIKGYVINENRVVVSNENYILIYLEFGKSMNQETKYELVKFNEEGLELEVTVSPKEETIWLSQYEIAVLFNKDRKTITRHIQNILRELELDENQVCSKKEHTARDGKTYQVNIYNLDMIIAIGYKVKSTRAISFKNGLIKY